MEYIIISGIKINIKQYGFKEEELLDGRLRNLINEVIIKARK